MLISRFSKDGKRGFALGSNNLTEEKIAAGLITAASGLLIAGVGGLLKINKPKKTSRAGAKEKKKKPPIWLALLPIVFKKAKTAAAKKSYNSLISGAIEQFEEEQRSEVEVIEAIPIASESEVYDHI